MHASNDLIPWAKRLGFIATGLAAAAAGQFGWAMGSGNFVKSVTLAGFCVVATAIVGYALVFAYRAHMEGRTGIRNVSVFLFAGAVCVELLGAFGFNAAARVSNMTTAKHNASTYADTRGELDAARSARDAIKVGRAPAAISADMASLETRPWFSGTANCATPGGYGNSCRRYQGFKAELATAQERARLDAKVTALAAAAATADVGHSDVNAQNRVVASVATFSMAPTAEQEHWAFIAVAMIFAVFMVMSSLLNFLAYAFDAPLPSAAAHSAEIIQHPTAKPKTAVATLNLGPSIFATDSRKAIA